MTPEGALAAWGPWAVFLITFCQGEAVALAAGFAAHRGLVDPAAVLLAAALGSCLGDSALFHLARWKREWLRGHRPHWVHRLEGLLARMGRWQAALPLFYRFIYGSRAFAPLALGLGGMEGRRFDALNAAGALLWAASFVGVGWVFGSALESFLGRHRRLELGILIGMLAAFGLVWLARFLYRRGELSALEDDDVD